MVNYGFVQFLIQRNVLAIILIIIFQHEYSNLFNNYTYIYAMLKKDIFLI